MAIIIVASRKYKIDGDGMTSRALEELRFLLRMGLVEPEKFKKATLCYNAGKGMGEEGTPEYYPLKFYSEETKEEIWLSQVTAGYRGTGPSGTIEALKIMGFPVNVALEEEIKTKKITDEIYMKP